MEADAATDGLWCRTTPLNRPLRLLDHLRDSRSFVWQRDGEGFVAWGEAARVPARLRDTHAAWQTINARLGHVEDPLVAPGTGVVAFGSFPFHPHAGGSSLVVPEVLLGTRGGQSWVTLVGTGRPPADAEAATARVLAPVEPPVAHARVRYAGSTLPELDWLDAVDTAVRCIHSGEVDKVVLARDRLVWAEQPFDARVLVRRLAARFPSCFTFSCDGLVGATPELLVRRTGRALESLVLAGSIRRGAEPTEDAALGRWLLQSGKDVAEHGFAVASVAHVLGRLCAELVVPDRPDLLTLENVQHLATAIRGRLRTPLTVLQAAERLHPTAAVCGAPTDAALAMIGSLEGMDRGRYAGPVGWVDERGDGEWAIALRCAQLDGARARLFAGAGIVAGSLPEGELEETRVKLRAMQSAFEGAPVGQAVAYRS